MTAADRVWREHGLRSAVLAGDARAWQTWYDESFDGLDAFVRWRCAGLRDLADEIVQETWLTAVRSIRRFDPQQGSFLNWLRGIAANLVRNELRRRAVRHAGHRNGRPLLDEPAERELERREQAEGIARALAHLPEHYETVLRAKYLDAQSMNDIAAARGETVKAVESLLTRARQAFREAYQRRERHHDRQSSSRT